MISKSLYDNNKDDEKDNKVLDSPITLIGFSIFIFLLLVPLFVFLILILKQMCFVLKIKTWRIKERPRTPRPVLEEEESRIVEEEIIPVEMEKKAMTSFQSNTSKKSAKEILDALPP